MSKACVTCKYAPPMKKWPCVDCDMREHDRWERKERKKQTHFDRIRNMTVDEMAKAAADYVSCHDCPIPFCKVRFTMERIGCIENWLDYLNQEVSNDFI